MSSGTKNGLYVLLIGLCLLPILAGCDYLLNLFDPPVVVTENYGLVMGKATDTAGIALGGVTVTVGGQTADTNDQGWFSIANVAPGDRVPVQFSKNGYAPAYQITEVQVGRSSFVEAPMGAVDVSQSISTASGGTVTTPDGGAIEITADSLVDSQGNTFTGTANVTLTVFDPSDDIEANAFPGEYIGISVAGETVSIKSLGFMDISVTGSSGDLQLAAGETATVKIPVPISMQEAAASMGTCPLWHFDTETGYWQEEGQGTYDPASGCFVGTISHFSVWNNDVSYPRAYISGRVVDSSGNPVQGAQVKCSNPSAVKKAGTWNSGERCTPADGTFHRIPIEAGVVFTCQASKGGQKGPIYTFGPFARGTENYVGDILLDAPIVQITLTWGVSPNDLDSHLAANMAGTFHVYFENLGSLTSEPYAALDTDDTTSYGPEVTSITNLRPGRTYRFSVRHYTGTGDIGTSGAVVNVVIDGIGIYRFTPPAGQPQDTKVGGQKGPSGIWRVIDIVVDATGNVRVDPINDYVLGPVDSGLLYP